MIKQVVEILQFEGGRDKRFRKEERERERDREKESERDRDGIQLIR